MHKLILLTLLLLFTAYGNICIAEENTNLKMLSIQKNNIVHDEAEAVLKNRGVKKVYYKDLYIVDEAEKVLSGKKLYKPAVKNTVYSDDVRNLKNSPFLTKTVYTGGVPLLSGVPVKIATDKDVYSQLRFKRVNRKYVKYYTPYLGTKIDFTVLEDVVINNKVVIPKGTPVYGYVTFNMPPGDDNFDGLIEVSRFYFERGENRYSLQGTIGSGELSSPKKVLKNEPISLQSFGSKTTLPFIKFGSITYIRKNIPYVIYFENK